MPTSHSPPPGRPRIVVVGPCASGKSTLVSGLREHGYDALASGQEHSEVHHLWRRTNPDVVKAVLALAAAALYELRGNDRLAEIKALTNLGRDTNQLDEDERRVIANILDLHEVQIKDIMTPKTVMRVADEAMTMRELHDTYPKLSFSRVPLRRNLKTSFLWMSPQWEWLIIAL